MATEAPPSHLSPSLQSVMGSRQRSHWTVTRLSDLDVKEVVISSLLEDCTFRISIALIRMCMCGCVCACVCVCMRVCLDTTPHLTTRPTEEQLQLLETITEIQGVLNIQSWSRTSFPYLKNLQYIGSENGTKVDSNGCMFAGSACTIAFCVCERKRGRASFGVTSNFQ